MALTEAGKFLYGRAGELFELQARRSWRCALRQKARAASWPDVNDGGSGDAVHHGVCENPEVNFEVHDGTTFSPVQLPAGGDNRRVRRAHAAAAGRVEHAVLRTEPMMAVSSPALHARRARALALGALTDRPLIIYRRYEKLIMDAFHAQGLEPDVFCICDARGAVLW